MHHSIEHWLRRFDLDRALHAHAYEVFCALPTQVRDDLVGDPSFRLCDYEPAAPGQRAIAHIPVAAPGANRPSRSVVLKRTLRSRPGVFVRYVIAHELAHAHLHNKGRWHGEDPERAADALAEEWGFPRPTAPG